MSENEELMNNRPLGQRLEEESRASEARSVPAIAPIASRLRPRGLLGRMGTALAVAFLLAVAVLGAPPAASAGAFVGVLVSFGPPALPYYAQPFCPGPGYIWTPGYWAWSPAYGYFWVPGTWVLAPFPGALWTPGYWDWDGGGYAWNEGYWGPVVGFYGGIDYGYGYTGYGYQGGYWNRGAFYYNRSVNNVNITNIRNVYYRNVVNNSRGPAVSYNGGRGGVMARPTPRQIDAARERRYGPLAVQRQHIRAAQAIPQQRASVNHGRPEIAATPRPGMFRGRGVVFASRAGAAYHEPSISRATRSRGAPARRASPGYTPFRRVAPQRQPARRGSMGRVAPARQRQPSYRPQARRAPQPHTYRARQPMGRRASPARPQMPRGRSAPRYTPQRQPAQRGRSQDHGRNPGKP